MIKYTKSKKMALKLRKRQEKMKLKYAEKLRNSRLKSKFTFSYNKKKRFRPVYCHFDCLVTKQQSN